MKTLSEGSEDFAAIKKQWMKEAGKVTMETLPEFLNKLMTEYAHDYGTICHAMSAGSIATLWAMNNEPQGGITGFQSGAIMWEFIQGWNKTSNKTSLKLVDYDDFLYPQYADKFEKTITKSTWESIQKEALSNIIESDNEYASYIEKNEQYEIDVAKFIKKYPDYLSNKKHYDHIGMGNSDEHKVEKEKVERGFEFAPEKPYEPIGKNSRVFLHWKGIANDIIPFGYAIKG